MKKIALFCFIVFSCSIAYSQTTLNGAVKYHSEGDFFAFVSDSIIDKLAFCNDSIDYYLERDQFAAAINWIEVAKDIIAEDLGKECEEYLYALGALVENNFNIGNFTEAIQLCEEGLQIIKGNLGKGNVKYISWLSKLAACKSGNGNYHEANKLINEALSLSASTRGKQNSLYTQLKNEQKTYIKSARVDKYLDSAYKMFLESRYLDMRNECERAKKVCEMEYGKDDLRYAQVLGFLLRSYLDQHDLPPTMAIKYGEDAKSIYEKNNCTFHLDYVSVLSNLSLAYAADGRGNEAILTAEKARDITEIIVGRFHRKYATIILNLARYHSRIVDDPHADDNQKVKELKEAVRLTVAAVTILETLMQQASDSIVRKETSYELLNAYTALAREYIHEGMFDEAVELQKTVLQSSENLLGKEHLGYKNSLANLIYFCCIAKKYKMMEEGLLEYLPLAEDVLYNNFLNLSKEQRLNYWNGNGYETVFRRWVPNYVFQYPTKQMAALGYNATLFSKGLFLHLSMSMSELLLENKDKRLNALYIEIQNKHGQLQSLYAKSKDERNINADSLRIETDKLERQLMKKSKVYGDYAKNIRINWNDVQEKLEEHDIAIEFVSFDLLNSGVRTDRVMYMAYVLDKHMDSPKMVPLFEGSQLRSDKTLYTTKEASELIWKPLAQYLRGKENVFFAPSGELYNIAIESLPHWSEPAIMSDKWHMYRLSSTRELAIAKGISNIDQATVYGGIQYDTDANVLIASSRKFRESRNMKASYSSPLAKSQQFRNGVSYLQGTLEEVLKIENTLKQKQIRTVLRTDTLATESDFKHLSGKKINLIHVATHGFYMTEEEAKYMQEVDFVQKSNSQTDDVDDKALSRSGLLLAGANNTLKGKPLPQGVDDGILTAQEISQMDLRGADLVVLSACQTGLGEIKGDGVFGLQRGFKKAGANSILMSLWKVDDRATMLLMTQFYKNLTSGMNKHESLLQAQKYLRGIDSKYQNPYYWAAFILLDAIN